MILFNIFAISSGLMLGWLLFDVLTFFKPKIYAVCLNLVEILEAKTNIRLRSKRNGFDLAQKDYNKIQIDNERARIKKEKNPNLESTPYMREWDVINSTDLTYITIETTNQLSTLD
jgi:hypothetical protein